MVDSIYSKGKFNELPGSYGQVIMDECHHAASTTAIEVVQKVNTKYVYGVSATPKRGDSLERIPELTQDKIERFIYLLKPRKEAGVDVTVITTEPENISYGSSAREAKEKIGAVVLTEIYDVLKENQSYDEKRYGLALEEMVQQSIDLEDEHAILTEWDEWDEFVQRGYDAQNAQDEKWKAED